MKLTKYFHSCFLLEEGKDRILFDPGIFSFVENRVDPSVFTNIQAIFITHNHADHVDVGAIKKIILKNPGVSIFTNQDTQEVLNKENIACTIFESGEKNVSNFKVRAIEALHEKLLAPVPHNTAFLVNNTFLTTGDSINSSLYSFAGVKVLALPILAPWGNVLQVAAFMEAMRPTLTIPAHDGSVLDFTLERQHGNWKKFGEEKGLFFHSLVGPTEFLDL